MTLNKRWLVAGIVCSFMTNQVVFADDPNSPESPANGPMAPGTQPPPLLAPVTTAKPLQGKKASVEKGDKTKSVPVAKKNSTEKNSTNPSRLVKTTKLSPGEPKLLESKSSIAIEKRNSASVGNGNRQSKFVSMLPGNGLQGWVVQEGRIGAWSREGKTISCRGAGGGWLRTEKEYSDFHLKFDYRYQPGANTGVGIRCPSEGNPTFTGIEIQLLDDQAKKYRDLRADQYTGSIYYQVAPTQKSKLNSPGKWNQCEVICISDLIKIKINGEVVNQVNLAKPADNGKPNVSKRWKLAERPPIGHIALQSHPSQVDFRNLFVKDLAVETPSGVRYVDMTAGTGPPVLEPTTITFHYVGQLRDGTRFGDTRDFGEPVKVHLDEVIEGWKNGILGMRAGGKRRLIVPPEMAYGSEGVENLIPPNSTLVFEVELRGFER